MQGRTKSLIWIGLTFVLAWVTLAGAMRTSGADGPFVPAISDPYHHISGVVAVPPDSLKPAGSAFPGLSPATPPIFGVNVSASLTSTAVQNETTIAIDPENRSIFIAAANDYRSGLKPWVYRSSDGGAIWVNYQVPGTIALNYGDPAMAFGHGGRAYFSYLGYQAICAAGGGMYASHSPDAGATFSAPVQLASNSNDGQTAVLQDKEYVTVDNNAASPYTGTVYVAWTHFAFRAGSTCGQASSQFEAPIILSRSSDEGVSWSVPITVSPPISNNNQGAVPAVGRHGEVYVYYVGAQTQSQLNYDTILFSRSTDGGQTFPFFTHIASLNDLPSPLPPTSFRDNAFGALAVDQQLDGYLYAVWSDYGTGDADILFSRSTDNGTTWGSPLRVNNDPIANGKDQFFPWVATSPDGLVHVGWFDRREDPNNRNYKEYYADSTDHGATFEANLPVSSAPSVPGGSTFIGDYSGIAATTDLVVPIWTDIRSGDQNAYIARGDFNLTVTPTPTASSTPTPPLPTITTTPPASPTTAPTPCTIQFSDVPPGSTFYAYVRCLACRGILGGYSDGTFRPGNNITRGQLAKIVSNSAGFSDPAGAQLYEDVPPTNTFFDFVQRLSHRGVMGGYACGGVGEPCVPPGNLPYFRPNNNATRGQIAKIDVNTAVIALGWTLLNPPNNTFEDVAVRSTFYQFVETAEAHGVMGGYACGAPPAGPCVPPANKPYFLPNNNATRGQTAKIVANAFFPACQTPARP